MKYMCMECGKIYEDKCVPIIKEGDGCCSVGSLIELDEALKIKLKNNVGQTLRKIYNV